jgi:hypothetical protein
VLDFACSFDLLRLLFRGLLGEISFAFSLELFLLLFLQVLFRLGFLARFSDMKSILLFEPKSNVRL